MLFDPRTFVTQVADLHAKAVTRWHAQPLDNPYTGILAVVCEQHQHNFRLSQLRRQAQQHGQDDHTVVELKREIDARNEDRNRWIERIDETLVQMLSAAGVIPESGARLHTETPGSVVDRLSVLALRVYDLRDEMDRDELDDAGAAAVHRELQRCTLQHGDLVHALSELLLEILSGRKLLRVHRQLKQADDDRPADPLHRRAG